MEFWKLEEFPQNPKIEQIPRVSKIPKIKKTHPKVWNFGNSRNLLGFLILKLTLEFPKIRNLVGILETREIFLQNPKIEQIPRVSKIPKTQKNPPQGLGFWKLEEFARFFDFEAPARVSKNPKLGLEFLEFWNFGNSRNFLKIQTSSKFLEFPKFQNSKNSNPSFGFLETRAGASKSKIRANSSSFQNSKPWGGFFWIFGISETRGICSIFGFLGSRSSSKNPNLGVGFFGILETRGICSVLGI